MNPGKGVLSGKKTYIVGIATVLAAVAAYLTDAEVGGQVALALPDLAQFVVTAVLAMTVRHGIGTTPETKTDA